MLKNVAVRSYIPDMAEATWLYKLAAMKQLTPLVDGNGMDSVYSTY